MVNKKVLLPIISALFILIIVFIYWKTNFTFAINHNIRAAAKNGSSLSLSDVIPFDWDEAFIIEDPYIGGEALDKIVGVKCNLKRSDVDSIRRIVFTKDKKFVYDYLYNCYKIQFVPLGVTIHNIDCKFFVEETGPIVRLKLLTDD